MKNKVRKTTEKGDKAENNFENIIITSDDSSLAQQFIREFTELKKQFYPNENEITVYSERVE